MEAQKTLTNDELIQQLLELLKKNSMKSEANDVFEICSYVDGLEKKLNVMTDELLNVKQQLKDMQEDTIFNNLKKEIQESSERLQVRCNVIKEQLFVVKDNIKFMAADIVSEAKKKGKAALNKVTEFFGVKEKLVGIRDYVQETQREVANTVAKIDAFGAGIREANQKIANTFRTFADKGEVDYSQKEISVSKTEIIKKPWIAKQKILEGMEVRLDAAIDKIKKLSRDVEINQMIKMYDELMNKPHEKSAVAMVAEPDYQYGADAFEAYGQKEKELNKVPVVSTSEFKKDNKAR
ncbi:MAG: hypothetical protein PHX08_04045 [Lachnospiraceae bacterium]|nr:hypothetical protein [Lachnospiraceae bacterium]